MAIRLRVECAATWRFSARGETSGGLRTRLKLVHLRQNVLESSRKKFNVSLKKRINHEHKYRFDNF